MEHPLHFGAKDMDVPAGLSSKLYSDSQIQKVYSQLMEAENGCWLWRGTLSLTGYTKLYLSKSRTEYVHRISYQISYGKIPDGLVLDHICHDPAVCTDASKCQHRYCCNPRHLVAKTNADNARRNINAAKVRCPHGHPYAPGNTNTNAKGHRRCIACRRRVSLRAQESAALIWPSDIGLLPASWKALVS